jgi:hypothetical protein
VSAYGRMGVWAYGRIGVWACRWDRRVTCIRYPSAVTRAKRFAPRTTGIKTASPIKT